MTAQRKKPHSSKLRGLCGAGMPRDERLPSSVTEGVALGSLPTHSLGVAALRHRLRHGLHVIQKRAQTVFYALVERTVEGQVQQWRLCWRAF